MAEAPTPLPRPVATVPPVETPTGPGLLGPIIGVAVIAALYLGREILIPITLAVLLSFVLAPVVDLLRRIKVPRLAAVLLSALLALGVILALAGLIGTQLASLAGDIPRYQTTIQKKVSDLNAFTIGRISEAMGSVGQAIERARPRDAEGSAASAAKTAEKQKPMPVEVHQPDPSPMEMVGRLLSPVLKPLETTGIIFIVAIFILMQREDLRDRLIRLFGSTDLHRTTAALDDAARRLSRYFLTQVAINSAFGVVIGTGLYLMGIPSPVLWGVIAALMRFVPYIGAFIAAAPPLVLAAAVDPGWTTFLGAASLFILVEPLMGQVVEPLLYGHNTGLSPISVILAAIFWGWLWGPIGLILSMPLTLCSVVLGRHVEKLEFLDVLLGDRPALTPIENFYQRLLAGDPDEAQDHADLLLKERSLSSYYDEVALKGLQLAAADVARGVLTGVQLERIRNAVSELVESLEDYEDVDPAPERKHDTPGETAGVDHPLPKRPAPQEQLPDPAALAPEWHSAAPVLCVAGRGPLDEAASMFLAQLLRKHGLGARVVPYQAVSRTGIAHLDVEGVAMVCVSYLDIRGRPSHLRYLLRRLKQRLPHARFLVGLWPSGEPALIDRETQRFLGADYYAETLRDAVEVCIKAARDAGGEQDPAARPAHEMRRPALEKVPA